MPLLSSTLLLRTHSLTLLTFAYYLTTSPSQLLSSTPVWLLGESMSIRPAAFATEEPGSGSGNASPLTTARSLTTHALAERSESEQELFALLAVALVVYAVTQFLFAGDLTLMSSSTPAASTSKASPAASSASASSSASRTSSSRYAEELHTLLAAQSRWLSLAGIHVLVSSALVLWIYVFHSHSAAGQSPADAGASAASLVVGFGRLANRVTFTLGLADMLFWGYLWTVLKEEGREMGRSLATRRDAQEEEEDD